AFLTQILIESGCKTGSFNSPAIEHFTEQFKINNHSISEEDFARILTRVAEQIQKNLENGIVQPTQFEILVAVAFLYFLEQHCDIVVLETGMGGLLDATNVIPSPEAAVIMTISMDHTEILGHTLAEIATQKAGIIKEGTDVLLYPQKPEADQVFEAVCREKHARLHRVNVCNRAKKATLQGQYFDLYLEFETDFVNNNSLYRYSSPLNDLFIPLLGSYQCANASMAVAAAEILAYKGYPVTDSSIRKGLRNTIWHGRFELMHTNPAIIVDGGHNPEGAIMLRDSLLRYFPDQKITFIMGILADKDYHKIIDTVGPLAKCFYTVPVPNPRALDPKQLAKELSIAGYSAIPCTSIEATVNLALQNSSTGDVICSFGSLYYVGRIREYLKRKKTTFM
ncbi:MAG: bifunctional folylpolyglutamate synthase/dihydrofolate synthase, partial [Bilifractor sp.]